MATAKLGLDKLFPDSQVNAGILVAILFAIGMYILMNKTTLGYELKACGMQPPQRPLRRHHATSATSSCPWPSRADSPAAALRCTTCPAIRSFSGARTRRCPAEGFNGIPVALLAVNNPIAVIFTAIFMSVLEHCGPAADQPHGV